MYSFFDHQFLILPLLKTIIFHCKFLNSMHVQHRISVFYGLIAPLVNTSVVHASARNLTTAVSLAKYVLTHWVITFTRAALSICLHHCKSVCSTCSWALNTAITRGRILLDVRTMYPAGRRYILYVDGELGSNLLKMFYTVNCSNISLHCFIPNWQLSRN